MSYQVHMVTKEGRPAVLKSISTPERAMQAVAAVFLARRHDHRRMGEW